MRRILLSVLFVVSSVGFLALPSGADPSIPSKVVLAFDFTDNQVPAAVSNGAFNIITDVLPGNTGGVVRMIAAAPLNSNQSNLVCDFQPIRKGQVECSFNFTTSGIWTIHTQYQIDKMASVSSSAVMRIRVGN
jgi:hypothetical protein